MRIVTALLVLLCAASIAMILISRLAVGPADLYEKDQPKTLAYTADVLLHDRWALPRDVIYQPATKPPLYNWIAAVVIKVTGSWSELAMKSPSVLGAIGVAVVLAQFSWRERSAHLSRATAVAALSCAIWFSYGVDIRHGSTIRLLFLARPDMLQAFFLTGAWATSTMAFTRRSDKQCTWLAAAFWACIIGAILTKGPLALLAFAYACVAGRVLGGSWRSIVHLRPIIGLLATIAAVGSWFFFAYRTDPAHVRAVMLGAEIVDRVTRSTPEGNARAFWYTPMWFVTKGGPFSVLAVIAVAGVVLEKLWRGKGASDTAEESLAAQEDLHPSPLPVYRAREPDLAAAMWLFVLLVGLTLPAGKRVDYLLPAWPPAAYLAARLLVSLCQRFSIPVAVVGLLPLYLSFNLARANLTSFHEAREHWSDRAIIFASDVREKVRDDPLLVIVRGKHPITTLLQRHQGSSLDLAQLQAARWIVLPLIDTTARPLVQSELVPLGFEVLENRPTGVLGLFDMQSNDRPTIEELTDAQRRIGDWTFDENPYHASNTVWRE